MKFHKDYYSKIFLFTAVSILIYVFFKSEFFWNGNKRDYYKIYYLVFTIAFILSLISFLIKKKIKLYLSIFLISFLFSLYLFEYFLNIKQDLLISKKEKLYFEQTGKILDKRSKVEIFNSIKLQDKNIKIVASPHYHMYKKKLEIFPLSGYSNSKTINCKENGYYSIFKSDRYGFNNPDDEWDKSEIEYLLIGDSFAKGSCVNRPDDISSILRKLYSKSTLTIGYNSKGPLMGLASLKEYIPPITKKVIWLYFEGNDIYNLEKELKNNFLKQYLVDKNFSQNLIKKQNDIDKLADKLILSVLNKKQNEYKLVGSLNYKIKKFIKLYKSRQFVLNFFSNKLTSTAEYRLNDLTEDKLKMIIENALYISNKNNAEFYFVYLPAYERYIGKIDNYNLKKIKNIANKLDINFIDINKELFLKTSDPLKYFPFGMNGHYNEEGYLKVAEIIYQITK